jgi:putative transposase
MVTAGTYRRQKFFSTRERLDVLQACLFEQAEKHGWKLQAWAIMANHYHLVAVGDEGAADLGAVVRKLHSLTAREVNRMDGIPARKVWFQYWDTHLTFEKSYYARLNYVNTNAVKHGLVRDAAEYAWCSAAWFEQNAEPTFCKMVTGFKCDQLRIPDDF